MKPQAMTVYTYRLYWVMMPQYFSKWAGSGMLLKAAFTSRAERSFAPDN